MIIYKKVFKGLLFISFGKWCTCPFFPPLFFTVHPSTGRPPVCGARRLLGLPGRDGASRGPELHPNFLGQAQPPRSRQGCVCWVGKCYRLTHHLKSINAFINVHSPNSLILTDLLCKKKKKSMAVHQDEKVWLNQTTLQGSDLLCTTLPYLLGLKPHCVQAAA